MKAIIFQSLLFHLWSYHNLELVHLANSVFHLSLNATDQYHSLFKFDVVPWSDFEKDLIWVLDQVSNELLWFANNCPPSPFFMQIVGAENTQEENNTQISLNATIEKNGFSRYSVISASRKYDSEVDKGLTWCLTTENLVNNSTNPRIDPELLILNSQIKNIRNRLQEQPFEYDTNCWFHAIESSLEPQNEALQPSLLQQEFFNDDTRNESTDKARLDCIRNHSGSMSDAFETCEYLIHGTRQFSSTQSENETAQYILNLTRDADTLTELDAWGCGRPEKILPSLKTRVEDTREVALASIERMEDVISQFALHNIGEKITDEAHGTRSGKCPSYVNCRLDRVSKTLRFLREIAIPRLADQLVRIELASPLIEELRSKRQAIIGYLELLEKQQSWIHLARSRSGWRKWVWRMTGLTLYERQRMVFPPFETIANETRNANQWVTDLKWHHSRIKQELSGTIHRAKRRSDNTSSVLRGSLSFATSATHIGCELRIVSRWNLEDKGQREDGYASTGNYCFLQYCGVSKIVRESSWQRLRRWMSQ
ncbi:unnamed protein product [Clonostachys rosea]|uniref:Uncharacterized protein n=1 Tax=Bionectria ochroleuca TaxID=29856 RepID=A0ABY6UH27_BIOOC|nr:unnamed protein product [Clonostachys rosea]